MTLQQLRYLTSVAEYGNITAAAQKLFVSQPTITNAIRDLEKEMKISIFTRTNKGVVVSSEGEKFLGYARQILEQVDLLEENYKTDTNVKPHFSVSCQHYSFAVDAFIHVIKKFEAFEYDFTLREEQTHEIIEDVCNMKSELGILYLSSKNREVILKLLRSNEIEFTELFTAKPHVFISAIHPLAKKKKIKKDDLSDYPYLTFEQGEYNSFYFSEEFLSTLDCKKNIRVRDRATLFNLLIGLNGFTVSSGVISKELNGENIIAKPLEVEEYMQIGLITRKNIQLSRYGLEYIEALKEYCNAGKKSRKGLE